MEPNKLGTINVTVGEYLLGDYKTVYREFKKQQKAGILPTDGKLTLYTKQEAKKLIEEAFKNAPDCSNYGYTKEVAKAVIESLNPEKYAKGKIIATAHKRFGFRSYADLAYLYDNAEEVVAKFANHIFKKILPQSAKKILAYYEALEIVSKMINAGRNAYYKHDRSCRAFQGDIALFEEGATRQIATLHYKIEVDDSKIISKKVEDTPVSNKEFIQKLNRKKTFKIILQEDLKHEELKQEELKQEELKQEELKQEELKETIPQMDVGVELINAAKEIEKESVKTIEPLYKTLPEDLYQTVVKAMKKVKEELLPENTDVFIEHPTKIKKATVHVTHPVGERLRVGVQFKPRRLRDARLTAAFDIIKAKKGSNDLNVNGGTSINPVKPKDTTVSLTGGNDDISGGVIVGRKLQNTHFNFAVPLGDCSVGGNFNVGKPLNGTVEVNVPVIVYGVPLNIGLQAPLKNPLKARVRVSLPLPYIKGPSISVSLMSIPHFQRNMRHIGKSTTKALNKICRLGGKSHKSIRREIEKRDFLEIQQGLYKEIEKLNFIKFFPGIEEIPKISREMHENNASLQTTLAVAQESNEILQVAAQKFETDIANYVTSLQEINQEVVQRQNIVQEIMQVILQTEQTLPNATVILTHAIEQKQQQQEATAEKINALDTAISNISPERLAQLRANAQKNKK